MVITHDDLERLIGTDVYGPGGDRIGSVAQFFLDARSGDPVWLTVRTGRFGTEETFVPLRDASVTNDRITVAYDKDQVADAPRIDAGGPLTRAEEDELSAFYGGSPG
jgi:sporulation protein YlmC with PRC-barrel domain